MLPKLADFGLARGEPKGEKGWDSDPVLKIQSSKAAMLEGRQIQEFYVQLPPNESRAVTGVRRAFLDHCQRGKNMKSRDCRTFCGTR